MPLTLTDEATEMVRSLMPKVRGQHLADDATLDRLEALELEAFGDEDQPGLPTGNERFTEIVQTMAKALTEIVRVKDSEDATRLHAQNRNVVTVKGYTDKRGRSVTKAIFDDGFMKVLPPGDHTLTFVGGRPEVYKVLSQDEIDAHEAESKARRAAEKKATHLEWRARMAREVAQVAPIHEARDLEDKATDFARQAKQIRTELDPPEALAPELQEVVDQINKGNLEAAYEGMRGMDPQNTYELWKHVRPEDQGWLKEMAANEMDAQHAAGAQIVRG